MMLPKAASYTDDIFRICTTSDRRKDSPQNLTLFPDNGISLGWRCLKVTMAIIDLSVLIGFPPPAFVLSARIYVHFAS